ncbi:MAG: transglycosylase SLT domain-containing protein [Proteobacteria bacterium]|nr:transglycosylase SLT domain-containing protein [Pseudomonadota bacterium]
MWKSLKTASAVALTLMLLAGCIGGESYSTRGLNADSFPMRWDHVPQADAWEVAGLAALDSHAAILPDIVPADIDRWCPAYPDANDAQRSAFWLGLMSSLARHESTWNEAAVGGGGRWFGLVQISPATARTYGCQASSAQALLDGGANVSCALRIWAETVPRDGVIAEGRKGIAADWGPLHPSQARKREDIRTWVRAQPYCQG